MADHIETKFALVVQWDGYVVTSTAWVNAFRTYDTGAHPLRSAPREALAGDMRRVLTEWHGPLVAERELARLEALPRR
jgi:hypothetical protein